jgi:hypothetical protein
VLIHASGQLDHFGISADLIPDKVAEAYAAVPAPDPPTVDAALRHADKHDGFIASLARLYVLTAEYYGLDRLDDEEACREALARADRPFIRSGAIIGDVEIVDVVRDSQSIWAEDGQYHFVLRSPRLYVSPVINVEGRLRVWNIDVELPEMCYHLDKSIERRSVC